MFSLPAPFAAAVPPGSINTNIYASRPNREADRYLLREQRFQQQRMERMREQVAKEEKELKELEEKQKLEPKKEEEKGAGSMVGKKGNVETGKTAAKSASADLSASLARTTLGVGVRVVTTGLKAEMHNGKTAICLKLEASSGRWIVRIDETGEPAGLKPENLAVLPGKAEAASKPAEKPIDETQEEFLKMQREAKMKLTKGIHPDDLGRKHLSRTGPEKEDDRQQKRRFRERGQSRERRSRSRDNIAAGRSGGDNEASSDPHMPRDEKERGGSAGDTQDKSLAARARRTSAGSTAAAADSNRQRYDDDYSYYSERRCSWSRSRSPEELNGCRARGGGGQGRRRRDDSREDAGSYRRGASPAGRGGASSRSPSPRRRSERRSPGQRRARSMRGGTDRSRGHGSGGAAAATGGRRRGAG